MVERTFLLHPMLKDASVATATTYLVLATSASDIEVCSILTNMQYLAGMQSPYEECIAEMLVIRACTFAILTAKQHLQFVNVICNDILALSVGALHFTMCCGTCVVIFALFSNNKRLLPRNIQRSSRSCH